MNREEEGSIDNVDAWIRMVAINRLTGHSSGFFSVYSLPPNQAVTAERQKKINEQRNQIPDYRPIKPRILKKSKSLLKIGKVSPHDAFDNDLTDDSPPATQEACHWFQMILQALLLPLHRSWTSLITKETIGCDVGSLALILQPSRSVNSRPLKTGKIP